MGYPHVHFVIPQLSEVLLQIVEEDVFVLPFQDIQARLCLTLYVFIKNIHLHVKMVMSTYIGNLQNTNFYCVHTGTVNMSVISYCHCTSYHVFV